MNSGFYHYKYFEVTAPVPESRELPGLCPAFKEGYAVVGGNEKVTFCWTCFICFTSLCGFTDATPDVNPETAA